MGEGDYREEKMQQQQQIWATRNRTGAYRLDRERERENEKKESKSATEDEGEHLCSFFKLRTLGHETMHHT